MGGNWYVINSMGILTVQLLDASQMVYNTHTKGIYILGVVIGANGQGHDKQDIM